LATIGALTASQALPPGFRVIPSRPLIEPLRAGMSVLSLHDHKVSADGSRMLQLRQAIALPIYTLALVLEVAATALARRAAIAGDDWPG